MTQRVATYSPPITTMEISRDQMRMTRVDQRIRVEFTGRVVATRRVGLGPDRRYEVDMISEDSNAI